VIYNWTWYNWTVDELIRSTMSDVIEFKTDKRKCGVGYMGYSYRLGKRGADDTLYWWCIRRDCSGRLSTEEDRTNPQLRTNHNHPAMPESVEIRKVRLNRICTINENVNSVLSIIIMHLLNI
jgi:hypothetical protein